MELDITEFFRTAEPYEFSGSVAERGPDAGPQTWGNAMREAEGSPILQTAEDLDTFRDYMGGFGGWDDAERAAWTAAECNALLIQLISGDMREAGLESADLADDSAWAEYQTRAAAGEISGQLFRGTDGHVYYYIGS